MGTEWVAGRGPDPPLEDIVKSSIGIPTEGYTHQLHFLYPREGGGEALVRGLLPRVARGRASFRGGGGAGRLPGAVRRASRGRVARLRRDRGTGVRRARLHDPDPGARPRSRGRPQGRPGGGGGAPAPVPRDGHARPHASAAQRVPLGLLSDARGWLVQLALV